MKRISGQYSRTYNDELNFVLKAQHTYMQIANSGCDNAYHNHGIKNVFHASKYTRHLIIRSFLRNFVYLFAKLFSLYFETLNYHIEQLGRKQINAY